MSSSLPPLPYEYLQALSLIDEAHASDPRRSNQGNNNEVPFELHYARKMTRWLEIRCPTASPALQLACRAQHFKRWEIPRGDYQMTRAGYLAWRAKQKAQAAVRVSELLASPSIDPPIAEEERSRVASLMRKENLNSDEEAQILEDVACLVFLDDQFDDFERKSNLDEDKMVGILKKTWAKMTERGRELALQMELSERAKVLIGKALEG